MIQIIFTLRTLTPLFIAGTDQTKAELRAPSLRGLMRYWHRALVGGIVGTNAEGLKIVTEQETNVFGATDQGSAVGIRVSMASREPKEFTERISKPTETGWRATGKGYLLWSMAKSGNAEKRNLKPARWYFPPETSFQVTLSSQGQDAARLKQAIAAFWLLTHFGALGSRSRRCAGSLEVEALDTTRAKQLDMPHLSFQAVSSLPELQKQMEQGLQAARALYASPLPARRVSEARFDILAPDVCRIWLVQEREPWSSSEKAMQALGERLQNYRSSLPLPQRKIFGLPLPRILSDKRRASPLLLRVVKLQGEQYVGVAVVFKTVGNGVQMADYTLIDDWIETFPVKEEVRL